MPNKYHGNLTGNGKYSGGGNDSAKPAGGRPTLTLPEKTANWGGLPGKTQKSRAGGAPTTGHAGKFHVKQDGL